MSSTKILQPSCSPKNAMFEPDHRAEVQEHRRRPATARTGDELLQRLGRDDRVPVQAGVRRLALDVLAGRRGARRDRKPVTFRSPDKGILAGWADRRPSRGGQLTR